MKTKHIIFTDINETLYSEFNKYHPDLEKAIEAVKEHEDLELAICTANGMFDQVLSVADKLSARYIITSNGSVIYDNLEKKYLNVVKIASDTTKKIVGFVTENNFGFHSWDLDFVYMNRDTDKEKEVIHKFLGTKVEIKTENEISGGLLSIVHFGSSESVSKLSNFLETLDVKGVVSRNGQLAEIVPAESDKGFGVKWLCNYLNISLKDVASIGDSMNDVPMFKLTGKSYAVANSGNGVSEYTTDLAKHVNENGAGLAILDIIKYWYK